MELTPLRYFLQVYRSGSIRRAAESLNISQQALSKQIQNLEKELNIELFQRKQSGVAPTEYANLLAVKAEKVLLELDEFAGSVQNRTQQISGVVSLGVQCWQMAQGENLKYEALRSFAQRHSKVRLVWENMSPASCVRGVRNGSLDLCVCGMPPNVDGLEMTMLRPSKWLILMACEHPLACEETLTIEDLAGQRLIMAQEESESRNEFQRRLHDREALHFIDLKDYLFDLIGQQILGDGALMLMTAAQSGMFNPERFVTRPISFDRGALYLCRLANAVHSPAARALHQHLLDEWRME